MIIMISNFILHVSEIYYFDYDGMQGSHFVKLFTTISITYFVLNHLTFLCDIDG